MKSGKKFTATELERIAALDRKTAGETPKTRIFELSEKQMKKFDKWRKENKTPLHHSGYGTIIENFSFTFQRNGIGDSVEVKDHVTGKTLSLTDIDEW